MFNIEEWLKSLQPGASGSMMPTQMIGEQPLPPAPVPTPRPDPMTTGAVPAAPASGEAEPNSSGLGGMLAGLGGKLGTNDGKGGPTAFGGLLNFKDEDSKQAALRGLLGTSASLMAAGGPSDTPQSFLGNLGGAIGNGVNAYDGYKDGQTNSALKRAQAANIETATAKDQDALAIARKNAISNALRYGPQGGRSFNGGSNTGATAAQIPASAPQATPTVAAPYATIPVSQPASPQVQTQALADRYNAKRASLESDYNYFMSTGQDDHAAAVRKEAYDMDAVGRANGFMWDGQTYGSMPGFNESVRAKAYAEGAGSQAGTESEIRTEQQRNYDLGNQDPNFRQYQQEQKTDTSAKDDLKLEQDLRKEYTSTPVFKRYDDVRASYDRIQTSSTRDTGAGDIGVIFGFMKMLDPASVVREGEFATAENSSGIPDYVRNLYNKAISGERLTPGQREEFVSLSEGLYMQEVGKVDETNAYYSDIANAHGFDPARIVQKPKLYPARPKAGVNDIGPVAPAPNAPTPNAAITATIPTISGKEDYNKLDSGATYIDLKGNTRTKR